MPYIVTTNNSVLMIYNVTAPIASLWSILLQHPLRLPAPFYYSNYYVFMIYLATGTITSLGSIWSQQLLHLTIYIATATITSLRSISLQHLLRPHALLLQQLFHRYDLYYYSNHLIATNHIVTSHSYDLMIYIVPATNSPSRSIVLQPIYYVLTI